jgi:hypothetical protein
MYQKKVISKNVTEKLLLMFVKLILRITFFGAFFHNFFNGFEISVKFRVFDTYFDFFKKKFLLGHISTFFKL